MTAPMGGTAAPASLGRPSARVLVVAPTYEEAENIEKFLRLVRKAVPEADILVVDDNSSDGTPEIAAEVARELGCIELLHRPRKQGLGVAYRAGLALGIERGYDRLVQIDVDLSHDPAVLPALLEELDRGADLAIGSRYVEGGSISHWPWVRRVLSRYGNRYAAIMLGMSVRDATSGYRAYEADALKAASYAETRAKGFGFQIETVYRIWRCGGVIVEHPIVFADRVSGCSKLTAFVCSEELLLVTAWGVRDFVTGRRWRRRPRLRGRTRAAR